MTKWICGIRTIYADVSSVKIVIDSKQRYCILAETAAYVCFISDQTPSHIVVDQIARPYDRIIYVRYTRTPTFRSVTRATN